MKQVVGEFVLLLLFGATLVGCSGGLSPVDLPVSSAGNSGAAGAVRAQTHLWGFYDVAIDPETLAVTVQQNRQALFTANVVNFLNGKPAGLTFHVNAAPSTPEYIDVDIDVSITHPFPGMPQYNGYDVRGVFMGDGSASLNYNPDLVYPVQGTDQCMLADPIDGIGGPDGYTRWFNRTEFSTGGMPLFSYTQGKLATPGYSGSATLCPYRYFADGLGKAEDLWSWLQTHGSQFGRFSSGATNTRNYYLRFPSGKGIKYSYAITANWQGVEEQYHPSNAPEAVACSVLDTSNVWFVDAAHNGGNIRLDISVWDWDSTVSGGVMEDYRIFIESTVLSSVYAFSTADMTPVGGGAHYSTYHVEIPADAVSGTQGNQYWVIVEQKGYDYTNDFGVTNLADGDPLAAFFRYDLVVGNSPAKWIQVTSPNGGEVWTAGSNHNITWQSSPDIASVKIEYSKDGFAGDIHEIAASTENDGVYEWKVPGDPSTTVRVRVSDALAQTVYDVSDNDFTIQIQTDCGTGVHNKLQYEGTYQLNWGQAPVPSWHFTYDIASLPDGRVLMQGFSGGVPALMAFDVTQNGLVNGQVIVSNQWGTSTPQWIMSMDVCDVTGNIALVLASSPAKLIVFNSSGKHVTSIPCSHDVYNCADTDWKGGIWTIEYVLNSDPTPMGKQAFIEHYEWTGATYVHNPSDSLEITSDMELNPIKITEMGIVFTAKRLIVLEHSSYPWKGNMYNYDLSGGKPVLMPELTQHNFLSSPLSESQIGHWRKAFDIEIDHSDPALEECRIMLARRSGSGWDDGSYFTRYDINMNMLGEYHVPGTPSFAHLLETFTLCPNAKDPDGIFLTIHEGWLSHPNMDAFEVYAMPADW